ncbi:hypothetical protein [Aurantimonas endophytica]|uniref:Uncharacterized protein n=1 Tax=Aurantimonas endophytica TaxID=1522175 RepID=A0A7W6MQX8_9HYPH|nr:hypothetical protein [Aurantimonas endophytica]MBB4004444.1 hypothetical protein [Aurantimonas endophytica]MCO6405281.1 hypothetical protein [Aurantimonas endophytica]
MPATNRHPVDELADIREQKKALAAREDELKTVIFDMASDDRHAVGGDQYVASIKAIETKRLDRKAVEKVMGCAIERCLKSSTTLRIDIEPRAAEAA